jgi:hypothetical protein
MGDIGEGVPARIVVRRICTEGINQVTECIMEWEYCKECGETPEQMEAGFSRRGIEGWELVSVIHNPDPNRHSLEWVAYFKRQFRADAD